MEPLYFYRVIANFELGSSAPSKIISASRSLLSADIEISTTKLDSENYSLEVLVSFRLVQERMYKSTFRFDLGWFCFLFSYFGIINADNFKFMEAD